MADELLTLGANSGTDVTNKVYEEHTVSGNVVTFPDGADGVPLKKCEITLPASLDGYSEVDVVSAGKNLLDFSAFSDYSNWKTDITENQSYPTANANRGLLLDLPQGTYTVSFGIDAETYPTYLYLCKDDGSTSTRLIYFTGANFSVASGTFTVDGTSKYYFRLGSTGSEANFNSQIAKIAWGQIETGSTASTFEPYSGTTHTADLGRTIHGGTVDVVNGTGESSYKIITVGNSGWNYYASGGYIYKDFNDKVTPTIGDTDHVLVTDNPDMPYGGVNYASQFQDLHVYQAQNKAIYIKDTSCTSVNDFYTKYSDMQIGYELATPETFTFTPITPTPETALGVNNFWPEQGTNIELTYYSEREVINNYSVTATQLTAIADAIREKKRTTNPILFEDFPDEIRTIETGGGGGEDVVTWVYTASGSSADNYYYTAQEDGLYLAVAVRNQNTGCSISLPDGGDVVLTSTLLSPRFQMKVVRLTAGQRINLYIYNSTHVRGGWIFKLNVTPSAIAYTRAVDQYGAYNIVNQGTSNTVLSILATVWGNSYGGWDPTMKCFALSPLNSTANIRIMYGIDMTMPSIPYGGPSTCQWILNIQED